MILIGQRNTHHEEPEMPDQHDEERPVEDKPEEPEQLSEPLNQLSMFQLGFRVPEERTEQENFEEHSCYNPYGCRRAVELVLFNPGEGISLAACSRDVERTGERPHFTTLYTNPPINARKAA